MYRTTSHALGSLARYAPARQLTPAAKQSTLLPHVQPWRAGTSQQSQQQQLQIINNHSNNARDAQLNDRYRPPGHWSRTNGTGSSIAEMAAWRASPLNMAALQMRSFYASAQRRNMPEVAVVDQNSATPERETETFNERIKGLKRNGNLLGVVREFSLMRSLNVPRNLLTYNLVLDSFVDLRQRDTSVRPMMDVYRELIREPELRPSAYTYRVLIRGLCLRELEVCSMRTQLETRLQWVNDDTDRARLAALAAEANLDQAMQLFDQARTQFSDPFDVNIMDLLLWATAERGDTESSLRVFEAIESSPVMAPSEQTFGALISSFGRAGDLEAARECFKVYMEQCDKGVFANSDPSRLRLPFNNMATALMRCGDLQGAHHLLTTVMPEKGVQPDEVTYNTLISGCAQAGDLESAEQYLEKMQQGPVPIMPGAIAYSIIISAACKQDMPTLARRMFDRIASEGLTIRYGNLMSYLELCVRQDDVSGILGVLTMIERNRDAPEAHLRQLLLTLLHRPSMPVEAKVQVLQRLISMQIDYPERENMLRELAVCFVDAHPDAFPSHREVMRSLSDRGVRLSARLTESLMRSYRAWRERAGVADMGRLMNRRDYGLLCAAWFDRAVAVEPVEHVLEDIYGLMRDMHANGQSFDHATCAHLAQRVRRSSGAPMYNRFCDQVGEIFGSALVASIKASTERRPPAARSADQNAPEGQRLDTWRLCTDIRAMSRIPAKMDEMVVRVNELLDSGALPPPDLMRMVLFALSAVGRMQDVRDIGSRALRRYDQVEITKDRVELRQAVLSTMIMSCAKNKDAAGARAAYDAIRADGGLPSRAAYGELLRMYPGENDLEEGMRMYKEMNCVPSPYFANVLLSKVSKHHGYAETAALFEEMRQRGLVPTAVTYGTLINAACKEDNEERAMHYYGEMCRRPEQENIAGPFHTMMQYALSRGDRASVLRYFTSMRRRMVTPQPHTYRLLIEAYTYAQPRDMGLAEQSLRDMLKAKLRPTGAHYAPLLIGHAEEGNVEKMKWLWSELRVYPHLPDETAYLAGIAAGEKAHNHEFAQQLREEMFAKKGISPPPVSGASASASASAGSRESSPTSSATSSEQAYACG
ncbi:hypothetical protein THASP1DRAFT_24489 [Thamnocephalis sphaerospora]|uniref:Pentacotripeptide-repeat region of PRORP domain-containing protein n=1 Tax=Thamnocephalis sphaerospora TaxID=78915 RepID=A0A4P9XQ05_9FUNG|nr:hypothetical protein THASP1DRAFT_24489 [Thamnocephalis sphaerospora]|eukprot:RKP07350.1 hypothetical protein THASP1DRAFT_24489 [Thamnocephalis sphaerospora]